MLFESAKERWVDPQKSIGRPCELKFKGTRCWEVTGPALEVFNKLSPAIDKLLADNQELLEQGEPKPRVVSFNMWMEGNRPCSAQPVIVFSSKSRRQRSYAKVLLKECGLLKEYPGISIKALDKMPAVHQARTLPPAPLPVADNSFDVFMTDRSSELFGAQIMFGNSKIATALGFVSLNKEQRILIPQHPHFAYYDEDTTTIPTKDHLLEFDEDSDSDDDDLVEITSAEASISSPETSETEVDSWPRSDDDSIFDFSQQTSSTLAKTAPLSREKRIPGSVAFLGAKREPTQAPSEQQSKSVKLATIPRDIVANDLDYECLALEDDVQSPRLNRIRLSTSTDGNSEYLYPREVASRVEETTILAVTGTTGLVKGTILENPFHVRMIGSSTCQEMWQVRLERDTIPGDCGAWVVNAVTGNIYGHIVAGDPMTGMAYIIPAHKVFADIERRYCAQPLLWDDDCGLDHISETSAQGPAIGTQHSLFHDTLRYRAISFRFCAQNPTLGEYLAAKVPRYTAKDAVEFWKSIFGLHRIGNYPSSGTEDQQILQGSHPDIFPTNIHELAKDWERIRDPNFDFGGLQSHPLWDPWETLYWNIRFAGLCFILRLVIAGYSDPLWVIHLQRQISRTWDPSETLFWEIYRIFPAVVGLCSILWIHGKPGSWKFTFSAILAKCSQWIGGRDHPPLDFSGVIYDKIVWNASRRGIPRFFLDDLERCPQINSFYWKLPKSKISIHVSQLLFPSDIRGQFFRKLIGDVPELHVRTRMVSTSFRSSPPLRCRSIFSGVVSASPSEAKERRMYELFVMATSCRGHSPETERERVCCRQLLEMKLYEFLYLPYRFRDCQLWYTYEIHLLGLDCHCRGEPRPTPEEVDDVMSVELEVGNCDDTPSC